MVFAEHAKSNSVVKMCINMLYVSFVVGVRSTGDKSAVLRRCLTYVICILCFKLTFVYVYIYIYGFFCTIGHLYDMKNSKMISYISYYNS